MAHKAHGAFAAVCRDGQRPEKIVKGDYRMKLNPDAGWRLDEAALTHAQSLLGLRWPVSVVTNAREGGTAGNYRITRGTEAPARLSHLWAVPLYHRVMLKSYLTPEEANESLWHELIHACQAEREGSVYAWQSYNANQNRGWNYNARPMEVEAREGAKKFSHIRLTKPR